MFDNMDESIYVVFGENTERVAGYLQSRGYRVIGKDRTLDAAAIMAPNLDEFPDTYLILASALVSGVVDVGINYGAALLENLSRLRMAAPKSRIVLMLPEEAEADVIQQIINLAIYDIHRVNSVSLSKLTEYLSIRKTIADYGFRTLPVVSNSAKASVDVEAEYVQKESIFKKIFELFCNIARMLLNMFARRREGKEDDQEHCENTSNSNLKPDNEVLEDIRRDEGMGWERPDEEPDSIEKDLTDECWDEDPEGAWSEGQDEEESLPGDTKGDLIPEEWREQVEQPKDEPEPPIEQPDQIEEDEEAEEEPETSGKKLNLDIKRPDLSGEDKSNPVTKGAGLEIGDWDAQEQVTQDDIPAKSISTTHVDRVEAETPKPGDRNRRSLFPLHAQEQHIPVKKQQKKEPVFFAQRVEPENSNIRYMPHQLITVWSPSGWAKSFTAFNLAALAAAEGFDAALINYDLLCPELDVWFGIKQTGLGDFEEDSAGVITFGDGFRPELVSRFLKERAWGIKYLPAGNKLGNIGTPEIPLEALEQALKAIYQRNTKGKPAITIVDAGRSYEYAPTLAALRQAMIVLIPSDGTPLLADVAKQQIGELTRMGYNARFIELHFVSPVKKASHICQECCSVPFDWMAYMTAKPQCLSVEGRRIWDGVLNQLAPAGAGNAFRRM